VAKAGPQAGILNRPPERALFAQLKFMDPGKAEALAALEGLREVVKAELSSQLEDPSVEPGELGFESNYDRARLTITLWLAKSAFDALETSQPPADLRQMS
jgi:hypothetical protein